MFIFRRREHLHQRLSHWLSYGQRFRQLIYDPPVSSVSTFVIRWHSTSTSAFNSAHSAQNCAGRVRSWRERLSFAWRYPLYSGRLLIFTLID
jgi:hypothetical protein